MKNDPQAIEAILAALPKSPANDAVAEMLRDLHRESAIIKFPFSYTATFFTTGAASNIGAGATQTVNVQIDAAAPFLICTQSYYANSANAAVTESSLPDPNIVVLLTDTGTNRQLMDSAVPVSTLFGSGRFPYVLPEPKLMQANSQLQVTATNRDVAAGFNLYLVFNGYKLYAVG